MKTISIHSHFLRAVTKHADGIAIESLLQQHDIAIEALSAPNVRINARRFAEFTFDLSHHMQDLILGYGGAAYPINPQDGPKAMLHAIINAPCLAEALERMAGFWKNFHPIVSFSIEDQAPNHRYSFNIKDSNTDNTPFIYEVHSWFFYQLCCWLTQSYIPLKQVSFQFSEPVYSTEYAALFNDAPVEFDGKTNSLTIETQYLELPIAVNREDVEQLVEKQWFALLSRPYAAAAWESRIRSIVQQDLVAIPSFTELAQQLELNPQTLRRKLAEEGWTYTKLKNTIRRECAEQQLGNSNLSVEEISHILGFSEASTFIRSFKKWTGLTPHKFRQNNSIA